VKRVLIVEDEIDLVEVLRAVLEDEGYAVDSAPNGRAALKLLDDGTAPDLLLVDVMMPVLSGDELVVQLAADPGRSHLPVVMMSAVEPAPAARAHARVFLRKPFSIEALTSTVAQVLGAPGERPA
jgi:CheY-like chemotaxis protein